MSDYETISNVPAEKQILGSLMAEPVLAEKVFRIIQPDDFSVPQHAFLATLLYKRHLAGESLSPTVMMTDLLKEGLVGKVGGGPYLFELVQHVEFAIGSLQLAEDVHRSATRRHLVELAARLAQQAQSDTCEPLTLATELQERLADVAQAELVGSDIQVSTLAEFLTGEDDEVDWVIAGLLARDDRLILTGAEGIGKAMLLRQFAVCAAAGLDPFHLTPVEPRTVLYVDLENPAQVMRQTIRKMAMAAQARTKSADFKERLFVERRPDGLNLANPNDVAWLMKRVTTCQPDILIIGPLYKMMNDNPNDEQTARAITVALDQIRTNHRCALMIEAHAGHSNAGMTDRPIRPTGSSLFMRWPEFGFGLRYVKSDEAETLRHVEFAAWRGARSERAWPRELIGATNGMAFLVPLPPAGSRPRQ